MQSIASWLNSCNPTTESRHDYLVKVLGWNVTPGFFHIWGLIWHGLIGLLLIGGLWLFAPDGKEPERSLGAFLPGFLWLGAHGPLTFFPTMWYADIVVLLPFVLVGLAEVILAHALLPAPYRRWLTWSALWRARSARSPEFSSSAHRRKRWMLSNC